MANEEYDPFKTSTGLADDVNITLTNFRFGYSPNYTDSDTDEMVLVALCDFKTDDDDIGTNGVLEEQIITIGKGWEAQDGGKKVVRADGKSKGFNKSTYMGLLVDKSIELAEDTMRARYEATKLTPMDAAFWEGFTGHFVQVETEGFNGQKGRAKLLPDRVDGWGAGGAAKPAKKAATKKAVAAKPAATETEEAAEKPVSKAEEIKARKAAEKAAAAEAEGGGEVQGDAGDDPMTAAIIALAKVCSTDEEFITRAYDEIDGLDESAEGMALVDDVESAESIWQTVGGTEV